MESATQPPAASAITQVFNGCTFVIHIGDRDEFADIVRELVDEGVIAPQMAERVLESDRKRGAIHPE